LRTTVFWSQFVRLTISFMILLALQLHRPAQQSSAKRGHSY
jgi:hypothetical protein